MHAYAMHAERKMMMRSVFTECRGECNAEVC